MQRRTVGKGQAHISPPKGSPSSMSGQDSENPSRLGRRSFGVTNRIWIILALILSILLLSRYILATSSSSPTGGHRLLYSDLKPKNYLNATELQQRESPFAFCPAYGEGDEVGKKYGALALTKSRLHLGSGMRIQRVVNKAMSGLPVTISVIGGSGMSMPCFAFSSIRLPNPTAALVLRTRTVRVSAALRLANLGHGFPAFFSWLMCADGPCADFALQYRLAMALERTLCLQRVIRQNSSIGGTLSSHTQPQNSQMAR